jgi:hypothetical protein
MLDFLKKRRAAEQQRKIDQVLALQMEVLALYEQPAKPITLQDELNAVAASFEGPAKAD